MRREARLILVRHLYTEAMQIRDRVEQDPQNTRLNELFDRLPQDLDEITTIATSLQTKYGPIPRDYAMQLVEGQDEVASQIMQKIIENFGNRIRRWEVSPYPRVLQTSSMMRKGRRGLPREEVIEDLREKSFGDIEAYPSMYIYLGANPEELARYQNQGSEYSFPNQESNQDFSSRIGGLIDNIQTKRRYRGTTIIVAHGGVIKEMIKQITGVDSIDGEIKTGTVTSFVAEPKKLRQRRNFKLDGPVGQDISGHHERHS